MKSRWKTYLLYAGLIIVGVGFIYLLVETIKLRNTGFEEKTLWDWMELLIIPLVLAIGAFFLQRSERTIERQVAEDRAELEREIARDRQQEIALQSYLDRMEALLLKEKLRTTKNKEIRNVARIRTLAVLRGLDPIRKGFILRFLYEANLINRSDIIIDLQNAELDWAVLSTGTLKKINLSNTNLTGTKFPLFGDLSKSDLSASILNAAQLSWANLTDAKLCFADFGWANLSHAILRGSDLSDAFLGVTDLSNADLSDANLRGAYLGGAILYGANVTDEQLASVKTLKGATMPDGTIHK